MTPIVIYLSTVGEVRWGGVGSDFSIIPLPPPPRPPRAPPGPPQSLAVSIKTMKLKGVGGREHERRGEGSTPTVARPTGGGGFLLKIERGRESVEWLDKNFHGAVHGGGIRD